MRPRLPAVLLAQAPAAGVAKSATPHTFRHAVATRWLEDGQDIRTAQELFNKRA
jgi:site-specific recombinase XerD